MNAGTVSGRYTVGGIAGYADMRTVFDKCLNIGNIEASFAPGALIGQADVEPLTLANSYYLEGTAPNGVGDRLATSDGTALSAEALQNPSSMSGLDFSSAWEIGSNGWPALRPEAPGSAHLPDSTVPAAFIEEWDPRESSEWFSISTRAPRSGDTFSVRIKCSGREMQYIIYGTPVGSASIDIENPEQVLTNPARPGTRAVRSHVCRAYGSPGEKIRLSVQGTFTADGAEVPFSREIGEIEISDARRTDLSEAEPNGSLILELRGRTIPLYDASTAISDWATRNFGEEADIVFARGSASADPADCIATGQRLEISAPDRPGAAYEIIVRGDLAEQIYGISGMSAGSTVRRLDRRAGFVRFAIVQGPMCFVLSSCSFNAGSQRRLNEKPAISDASASSAVPNAATGSESSKESQPTTSAIVSEKNTGLASAAISGNQVAASAMAAALRGAADNGVEWAYMRTSSDSGRSCRNVHRRILQKSRWVSGVTLFAGRRGGCK